jgi:DNA-binding CsgD family transcriptional regulator
MGRRRAANDPSVRVELSDRQRQVLDLIASGATNGEIAERLGITLDGAKWHVREILSRLDVDSREEAAEWWRSRRHWPRMPGWMPRGPWPAALPATAAGLAVTGIAFAAVLHSSEPPGPGEPVIEASTATVTAPATPTPRVATVPEIPQPPLIEIDSGTGWRLLVADDGHRIPPAREAVLAVRWDLETPYVDVLDVDGRAAARVETGYRPMARLSTSDNTLIVSDWVDIDADGGYPRILIFDLDELAFVGEVPLPGTRVNGTVFANWITLSSDGRWLYWVEHGRQTDPPSCATGGDEAVCDQMVVHAVDLRGLVPSGLRAVMPRRCAVPTMTPHGQSAVLAHCTRGAGRFVVDAALWGDASSAVLEVPDGLREGGWDMRTAPGATIALQVEIASGGDVTAVTVLDGVTGETHQRYALTDAWGVHLIDSSTALVLRSTGRLERMDLSTGDFQQLPYALVPGQQGLDIALVR